MYINKEGYYKLKPLFTSSTLIRDILHGSDIMTSEQLDDMFTYHPPTLDQTKTYNELRDQFRLLAHYIQKNTPECGTQTLAFRRLHESMMLANASIAMGGRV